MRPRNKTCLLLLIFFLTISMVLLFHTRYEGQQKNDQELVPRRIQRRPSKENLNLRKQESPRSNTRELRQKERRKLVEKFCKKTDYNIMPRLSHIVVVKPLKLLYCITPKVASRQWREMLHKFTAGKATLKRFPSEERKEMLETYFKFMFVREPFERILSAYKDKFVNLRINDRRILRFHGGEILKNFRTNASQSALEQLNDITFREFIEYLVTKGSNRSTRVMDWHWDNYVNICGMCTINYDFIGHYENFNQDLSDFKEAAGLSPEQAKLFNVYATNQSDTASSMLSYYSQIPLEWIVSLGRIFRANFEMFGYSFPGPLKSLFV